MNDPSVTMTSRPSSDDASPAGASPSRAARVRPWIGARRATAAVIRSRPLILLALIILLIAYMSLSHGAEFATTSNAKAVLLDAAVEAVMVIGMMILLIGGTFDLSVGGILTMTGIVVGGLIANHGWNMWLAMLAALAVGGVCGIANGLLVTRIRINALIATLATQGIFYGVAQLINSSGVTPISNSFAALGQNHILGFQLPVWIALVFIVVMSLAVSQTRFFRQYYFVGGNERAARLSGIPAKRLIVIGFVLMGVLSGVAGILTSARLNAATTDAGLGTELEVITAAVLGGASLTGGEGTVIGGVLGVLFIAIVDNALVIINVDPFWQQIVIGGVLLFALSLDRLKHTGVIDRLVGDTQQRNTAVQAAATNTPTQG